MNKIIKLIKFVFSPYLNRRHEMQRKRMEREKLETFAATVSSDPTEISRIADDYKHLYDTKGINEDEYRDFEFHKRSETFKQSFLGENEQRFYLNYLNPVKYYSFARNKFVAHKMMEGTGIRTSQLYCYYYPEARYDGDNLDYASNVRDVVRILNDKQVQSCVIKTTESSHGENVWVIKDIDYGTYDAVMTRFDGQNIRLSDVLGKNPLIFESVVRQTAQFSSFNASSVNTVRFMTALYPDGSARVLATFIKIGRAGKCVDNAGDGGNVDVCVDVDTGEIKYAIQFDGWHNVKEIDIHPDSGNPLNGVVIENWEAIKADVIKFQQAFPYCKAAGWDIAITDDGPVVIEVNDFWDRTGQFFIRRGWRDEIRDCYIAWKKTGAKYSLWRQQNPLMLEHLLRITGCAEYVTSD